MTQDYILFSEIVFEIGKLCTQKATGTLFIATKANRSAQIVLDKGEIVFILFSSKRGQEALDLMSSIREGRYRFQAGGVVSRRMQLPPTEVILQTLGKDSGQVSAADGEQAGKKGSTGHGLSPEQKIVLESCLTECIGPMAAIICEDHFNSTDDLQAAVDVLAGEIPSSGQAKRFRERVAEKLR